MLLLIFFLYTLIGDRERAKRESSNNGSFIRILLFILSRKFFFSGLNLKNPHVAVSCEDEQEKKKKKKKNPIMADMVNLANLNTNFEAHSSPSSTPIYNPRPVQLKNEPIYN